MAQRLMPVSANATGWRVFATEFTNRLVGVTRGFFTRVANRHGNRLPYQLNSIDERLNRPGNGTVLYSDGQLDTFEINPRRVFRASDT